MFSTYADPTDPQKCVPETSSILIILMQAALGACVFSIMWLNTSACKCSDCCVMLMLRVVCPLFKLTRVACRFFQQMDNTWGDAVTLCTLLALLYLMTRAWGELAKLP